MLRVSRWLVISFLVLSCVGFFSAKGATIYAHTSQALAGQWVMPVIPEPQSLILIGTTFIGLAAIGRRLRKPEADSASSANVSN